MLMFDRFRQATRSLLRSPATLTCIVGTLAISIGAVTTALTAARAVVFRALPYRDPERLLWVASTRTDRSDAPFSLPEFLDYQRRATTADIAAYTTWSGALPGENGTARLQGARMSANIFEVLGAQPTIGRLLETSDDRGDAARVAVLSPGLWRQQFAGDPAIIGRQIQLNDEKYTVVGVLPSHFPLPLRDIDIVVPLSPDRDPNRSVRSSTNLLRIVGRPRRTLEPRAVQVELQSIATALRQEYPVDYSTKTGVAVTSLRDYIVADHGRTFYLIAGAAGLLLAVAMANILSLLMVRVRSRQSEIAVRQALGGSAGQLAQILFREAVVLVLAGGIAGTALTIWMTALLRRRVTVELPRLDEVTIDGVVLGVICILLVVAVLLFTVFPFAAGSKVDLQAALRGSAKGAGSGHQDRRVRGSFIVAQIAFAIMLTSVTVSALQGLIRLERTDLGYHADSVFVARLSMPPGRYATPAQINEFADRLHAALLAKRNVATAGVASVGPLTGLLAAVNYEIVGITAAGRKDWPLANFRVVSDDYLATIGARVVAGRAFTAADDAAATRVAIVSRALVEQQMPGRNAVGQQLMIDDNNAGPRPVTIVGVVANLRHVSVDGAPAADIYIPLRQMHPDGLPFLVRNQFWMVRVRGKASTFGPTFIKALQEVDRSVAASGLGELRSYVDRSLSGRRLSAQTLSAFALVTLLLAIVGVYGVVAYNVEQRRTEIGLRVAFGASPIGVMRLVLQDATVLAVLGSAIGVVGAVAIGGVLRVVFAGLTTTDPANLAMVSLLLMLMSLIASLAPAWRAARLDPVSAIADTR